MKKQDARKKLTLQRESIRVLRRLLDEALGEVVGAGGPRQVMPPTVTHRLGLDGGICCNQ